MSLTTTTYQDIFINSDDKLT